MLFKSDLKSAGKVIERYGSTRMTRGTECKGISMEIDCLIQVRYDTTLLKSGLETDGKVAER